MNPQNKTKNHQNYKSTGSKELLVNDKVLVVFPLQKNIQIRSIHTTVCGDIWKLEVWWEGDLILEGCTPGCGVGGRVGKVGRRG